MARLIQIDYQPHNLEVRESSVHWIPSEHRRPTLGLPQIVWEDGTSFRPANTWAASLATEVKWATVQSNISKLLPYSKFLEDAGLDWFHFPKLKADRCLVRYRGHLVSLRDAGEISPAAATERMRVAIRFYRYLMSEGLIDPELTLWRERRFTFTTFDYKGFERTVNVTTTDLSIPNRKRTGVSLEDGLRPLSDTGLRELLTIAKSGTVEFYLMLLIGAFTGARIGTICDLKCASLYLASPDPQDNSSVLINVGPSATPPVATKFDVNGQISMPTVLLDKLLEYAVSMRRIKRSAKADRQNADLLFLNSRGSPYCTQGHESSSAIRQFTREIRKLARSQGIQELRDFRFHWTRATFGTRVTEQLLRSHAVNVVLAFVKRLLLHKNEATTLRYIRFVEQKPLKQAAANAFTNEFFGFDHETS